MPTYNLSTSGDKPRIKKGSGSYRPIYDLLDCYSDGTRVIFQFNKSEYLIGPGDTVIVNSVTAGASLDQKADALSDGLKSFFPKGPAGEGGGAGTTYTLEADEQSFTGLSATTVILNITGGKTLPAEKTQIRVHKNGDKLPQTEFTRTNDTRITVSANYQADNSNDVYTVDWYKLIAS